MTTWIAVKKKPTEQGWYIVWVRATRNVLATVTLAWFDGKWSDTFNFDNGETMGKVTHWMPLPPDPTGDDRANR